MISYYGSRCCYSPVDIIVFDCLLLFSACVVLSALSVCGRVLQPSSVTFPDSPVGMQYAGPAWNFDYEPPSIRTARQNNRRTTTREPQTTAADRQGGVEEFGAVPQGSGGSVNNNNNRQFGGNQRQTVPNDNGTRPTDRNQNQQSTPTTSLALRNSCNNYCKEITTSEYNPVCGTDNESYSNQNVLKCIARCGVCKYTIVRLCITTAILSAIKNDSRYLYGLPGV